MRQGLLSVQDKIVRNRKRNFLKALKLSGNVTIACKIAGWTPPAAKHHFDKDPIFRQEWEEAIEEATDLLEKEARRRAVDGFEKLTVYQGKVVYHRYPEDWPDESKAGQYMTDPLTGDPIPVVMREYSDRMLELLLKGNRPDKFRENVEVGITHKGGVLLAAAPKPEMLPQLDDEGKPVPVKELSWEEEAEQQQEQYRRKMEKPAPTGKLGKTIEGKAKRL